MKWIKIPQTNSITKESEPIYLCCDKIISMMPVLDQGLHVKMVNDEVITIPCTLATATQLAKILISLIDEDKRFPHPILELDDLEVLSNITEETL